VKGVVYENQASAAITTARALYPRMGDAVDLIEWAIVRDPEMGTALFPGSRMRMVVFQGAASVGIPTIEVVFEDSGERVTIHDMEFRK
jgi:hypothetical protein